LFTRSFTFPTVATNISGSLTMNADNAEVAYLNGTFVGDGSPAIVYGASVKDVTPLIGGGRHGYDSVEGPIDVTSQLTQNNALWIMTRNYAWSGGSEANPTALIYKLCYSYDMPQVVVQTETAWGGEHEFTGKNWAVCIQYTPTTLNNLYTLSFWAGSSYPQNPAELQAKITGVVVGSPLVLSSTVPGWVQFTTTWDAGSATHANIEIFDLRNVYSGDDFVIDDISFVKQ
jgi:hypothetical protein